MERDDLKLIVSSFSNALGKELLEDIEKLISSVIDKKEINVGIRDGYELVERRITFTSLMIFEDDETVESEKYKPVESYANENDYYFAAEEIIRFNSRDTFLGIIGKKWLKNELGDEFVEAVIFGSHNVNTIDCMLGSVRVNNLFNTPTYFAPGTLVALRGVEFKNTKYLEVKTYLTKFFLSDFSGTVWSFGDFLNRFYWNKGIYTTELNYSGKMEEGFYDYDDDENYEEVDYCHEEDYSVEEDMDYYDWLDSEFGDDADVAYWNTH